jgi:HSP20 family protein
VKTEKKAPERATAAASPLDSLRREVDRLFGEFDLDFWRSPFRRSAFDMPRFWPREPTLAAPAVDIVENDNAYEVTAELPGMDGADIEVRLVNDGLMIKGEKQEEKEEKRKDYHLHERHFGGFERYFMLPDGVDADKIEATFKKGVLTVKLPKKAEVIKPEKKIEVKTAA